MDVLQRAVVTTEEEDLAIARASGPEIFNRLRNSEDVLAEVPFVQFLSYRLK